MKKIHSLSKPVIYALCLLCLGQPVQGDNGETRGFKAIKKVMHQHALVVGINQYRHADGFYLKNLEGAVNDAHLLRDTLRRIQVNLPDKRVLLDAKATRAAFVRACLAFLVKVGHAGGGTVYRIGKSNFVTNPSEI